MNKKKAGQKKCDLFTKLKNQYLIYCAQQSNHMSKEPLEVVIDSL